MRRFKNILVVADEASLTDAVIARAVWLAQSNDAKITLVDVIDAYPGELQRLFAALPGRRAQEVEAEVIAAHAKRLEDLAASLASQEIEASTQVLSGTSFIEIIRQVLQHGHDLVLKGAHRGPDRPYLRAPDLHLLRKCPCPVWILNGDAPAQSARMLVAVDPDPSDKVRDALNRMVMQLATSLARNDGAKLDVMNAWHVQEEATLRHGLVTMKEHEIQAILAMEETQSHERLTQLMREFEEFADLTRVLHIKGVAADAIPDHVESESIDTLVMGTVGRTGIPGFFIGNTAETILNRVGCSVMAVKPEGFVSPVRLPEGETPS